MKTKLLVVVDMQNDFIDGALSTKEARELVPRLANYIRNFNGYVIATQDTHQDNYLNTLEGKKLPVTHCVENSNGWRLNDEINNAIIEVSKKNPDCFLGTVSKPTFGSFALIDTVADVLKDINQIEVCGLCTGICVLSNACLLRAAYPDMPITVNANYTECVSPTTKTTALCAMQLLQIDIVK